MLFYIEPHCTTLDAHLPIVVKNGVHVFYPHRINRSIKHDPLAVLNDRTGVLAECVSKYSYNINKKIVNLLNRLTKVTS